MVLSGLIKPRIGGSIRVRFDITLPDPNNRHVLAAAIRATVSIIVTCNLKDFPPKNIKEYGIEAQHPDVFINHLIDLAPNIVCGAIQRLRLSLKNPPINVKKYLETLNRQSLPLTVKKLSDFLDEI